MPSATDVAHVNAAADAVTKVLDEVGMGLANNLQPGGEPVTIGSQAFTMVVQKAVIPQLEVGSGEDVNHTAINEASAAALAALTVAEPARSNTSVAGRASDEPLPRPKALFLPVTADTTDVRSDCDSVNTGEV